MVLNPLTKFSKTRKLTIEKEIRKLFFNNVYMKDDISVKKYKELIKEAMRMVSWG